MTVFAAAAGLEGLFCFILLAVILLTVAKRIDRAAEAVKNSDAAKGLVKAAVEKAKRKWLG